MPTPNVRGRRLLVALPTMFSPTGEIDADACVAAGRLVAGSRADGAFVAGTTGEFPALEPAERQAVFDLQREALGDKTLVGHIGGGSTRQAIALLEAGLASGITSFAALTPYYLPASPKATYEHYKAISSIAAGAAQVYVYLFPARTNTPVTTDELARISELSGIIGVKVSGFGLTEVLGYRVATPAEFAVYTGNDADFPVAEANGLDGVVSGVASCFPKTFDRMIEALDSGEPAVIEKAHADVLEAVTLIAGDIGRIKVALAEQGIGTPNVRMSIEAPAAAIAEQIKAAVTKLES